MKHTTIRSISKNLNTHVFSRHPYLNKIWLRFKDFVRSRMTHNDTVKIELSATCNARCSFCWMFRSDQKPIGFMSLENFRMVIDLNEKDFLVNKTNIQPFFNGEAMINPNFFNCMDYLVSKKIRLGRLDTNLGVQKDMDRLMRYPWLDICVNVGGVTKEVHEQVMKTNFEVVTSNLRRLFEINKKKVFVKATPTKHNFDQLNLFPSFIKKLGGDPKRFEIGTTGFNTPAEATDQEIVGFFDEVVSEEVKSSLRFTYDFAKPRYDIRAKRPGCHFLNDCVTHTGQLTICCHDQLGKLSVGNAFERPIYELRRSEKYQQYRAMAIQQQFAMCKGCN